MHSCDKKKTTSSSGSEDDSAANRNTNATAPRIIIDSPSYLYNDLTCAVKVKNTLTSRRVYMLGRESGGQLVRGEVMRAHHQVTSVPKPPTVTEPINVLPTELMFFKQV